MAAQPRSDDVIPFLLNYIYPLRDACRYDDDPGEGYDHALLANRGPVPEDCWVHDAWIVKVNGELHPGLNIAPVPVRLEDVEEAKGLNFQPVFKTAERRPGHSGRNSS